MDTKDSDRQSEPTINTYNLGGSEFTIATYKMPTGFWACCQQIPSLNDLGFDAEELRETVLEKVQAYLSEGRLTQENPPTPAPPTELVTPTKERIKLGAEYAGGFWAFTSLNLLLFFLLVGLVTSAAFGVEKLLVPLAALSVPSLWAIVWAVLSSTPERFARISYWWRETGYRSAIATVSIALAWGSVFYICGVGHEKAVTYVFQKALGSAFYELQSTLSLPVAFFVGGVAGLAFFERLCSAMNSNHNFAQEAALQRDYATGLERILECKNVEALQALAREYGERRTECDAPDFVSSRRFSMYSPDAFRIITPLDAQRVSGVYEKLSNLARAKAANLPAKTKLPLPPMEL